MQVLVIVRGNPCNDSTYRPHFKSNCRKFYWCVRGQERLYTCPRNKKFSAEFKKCTNPNEVFCGVVPHVPDTRIKGRVRYPSAVNNKKYGDWLKTITPRGGVSDSDRRTPSTWWSRYEFGQKKKQSPGLIIRRKDGVLT